MGSCLPKMLLHSPQLRVAGEASPRSFPWHHATIYCPRPSPSSHLQLDAGGAGRGPDTSEKTLDWRFLGLPNQLFHHREKKRRKSIHRQRLLPIFHKAHHINEQTLTDIWDQQYAEKSEFGTPSATGEVVRLRKLMISLGLNFLLCKMKAFDWMIAKFSSHLKFYKSTF